ncbi:LysR family transcriptional regulator [Ramlibacter albus]|uniref:LysR family transcriptional regulator n=1 Tax=Ramlibacter albus TaxID=2079448 RepID=A0A923S888_9BURK|nr:LysR family transcriptional regulator [Ramlibacter albus]MBC5767857.1 LysR family transcriptional regulator [Ramlibacter albus]
MDKLRALEYFLATARTRSFSAAARELDVSVAAVARLVSTLETNLGVNLFERTPQGIKLTADGAAYLDMCQPILQQLQVADEALRGAASRPKGTLVVGCPTILSQHCILPELPAFHARYPEIQIDVRTVDKPTAVEANVAEVQVVYGWPEAAGLIQRRLANTRLLICASPGYWNKHGVPSTIEELEQHQCLLFRDQEGTVIDFWEHEREGLKRSASVSGWLVSTHRDDVLQAVIAGQGVGRFSDLSIREPLRTGQLVPVLLDWESRHAPPINLLYRSSQRRLPRVRLFIDFLVNVFRRMEEERAPELQVHLTPERPDWYRRRHGRASATPRH